METFVVVSTIFPQKKLEPVPVVVIVVLVVVLDLHNKMLGTKKRTYSPKCDSITVMIYHMVESVKKSPQTNPCCCC